MKYTGYNYVIIRTICSIIILVGLLSCSGEIRNPNIFTEEDGIIYLTFNTPHERGVIEEGSYYKDGKLFISKVYNKRHNVFIDAKNIDKVIDFKSFDLLSNFRKHRGWICNDDEYCYFKDHYYIYILDNSSDSPVFFIAGTVENYDLRSGNRIVVDGVVYSKAKEIQTNNYSLREW